MPHRLNRPLEMPERAHAAMSALSVPACILTLRFIKLNPDSTRQQVAVGTGMSVSTARLTLNELEHLGYVVRSSEPAVDGRSSAVVRYRPVREQLARDLMEAFLYLT